MSGRSFCEKLTDDPILVGACNKIVNCPISANVILSAFDELFRDRRSIYNSFEYLMGKSLKKMVSTPIIYSSIALFVVYFVTIITLWYVQVISKTVVVGLVAIALLIGLMTVSFIISAVEGAAGSASKVLYQIDDKIQRHLERHKETILLRVLEAYEQEKPCIK